MKTRSMLQVVLAWSLGVPRFPEPCHKGLVGPAVCPVQVQGLHQGLVCLE